MIFRSARHTTDLQQIIGFYCGILGLEILGKFENHDHYDGVFIGIPNAGWHLEFTVSDENPQHKPDDDDLLVFYVENDQEYLNLQQKFQKENIPAVLPKNPYWAINGTTYIDPDGFRIVITKK